MRFAVVVAPAFAIASALLSVSQDARADDALGGLVHAAAASEIGEARTQIDATLAQMRATSVRVRDQLRATRKRGTKRQVTCVDEALSRSDVALRHARDLGEEILAAYARGDGDAARAARGRLRELREAQRLASVDADTCAPRAPSIPSLLVDTTTLRVDIDPRIAAIP